MMLFEEKVQAYKLLSKQIAELEEQKKLLGKEILQEMPQETDSLRVADYLIRRYSKLSIKIPLDRAREFGAVKMEEVIDKAKIKKLHSEGHALPDVTEFHYIQISIAKT